MLISNSKVWTLSLTLFPFQKIVLFPTHPPTQKPFSRPAFRLFPFGLCYPAAYSHVILHHHPKKTENNPPPIYTHWFHFCPFKANYSLNTHQKPEILEPSQASMGRQSGGDANTKASSSIALLQERFRQLQKVKERREEKELLRMLSESERMSPSAHFDPSNSPFQSNNTAFPQNNRPTTTSRDQSLSLELDLQSKQADLYALRTTQPTSSQSLWHNGAASASSSKSFDNPDIDTSLHL